MRQVPEMRATPKPFTILNLQERKKNKKPIVMLTCYDYPSAQLIAKTDVDIILVGDSVAMTVHGHSTTTAATMEMMILHTRAVSRGIGHQLLLSDLPFLCHRISESDTIRNARDLIQAGAHAIKIEGGDQRTCESIAFLTESGVPVFGHLGLRPQAIHQLGGHRVQGREDDSALQIVKEAKALEKAGASAIVLECIPGTLAARIRDSLSIPVIGIGAGHQTDGQVLVWHDMLGIQNELMPKFLKQFATLNLSIEEAIRAYVYEVREGLYPTLSHTYGEKVAS